MESVDVLCRVDGLQHGVLVDVVRQWKLHQDAVNAVVVVQPLDRVQDVLLRCRAGQPDRLGHHSGLLGGPLLVANVHRGGGVVSDEHHGKTGHDAMLGAHLLHAIRYLGPDLLGYARSIDDIRNHRAAPVLQVQVCPIIQYGTVRLSD